MIDKKKSGDRIQYLKRLFLIAFFACVIWADASCSNLSSTEEYDKNASEASTAEQDVTSQDTTEQDVTSQDVTEQDVTAQDTSEQATQWDEVIPEYAGSPYAEINNNIPYFTEEEMNRAEAFEEYSDLDELGRCGVAYAEVGKETMPTEERGEIGALRPSGWHTVKYNDLIEGNYLYNRCHLIAYQLAGENANEQNLITGTRYLNVQGMEPFENEVAAYISETENHVLYRVTPIYAGENLVADGVRMEAWSVEDHGAGVCFNVFCYNVQPGIGIDYSTGDSWRLVEEETSSEEDTSFADTTTEDASAIETPPNEEATADATTEKYIMNTNTKKFHIPTCSSVDDMAEHNKKEYIGTADELISLGYSPCKRCLSGLY